MSYVQLSPPLPCVAPGLGPHGSVGFVHALAQDRLKIRFEGVSLSPGRLVHGASAKPTTTDITVTLGDQRSYALAIELQHDLASSDTVEARVLGEAALGRLADLLNLVRKGQHIAICETMDVEATDRYTGFSDLTLLPKALPEFSWDQLDTRCSFLGRDLALPLLITGMTGGLTRGAEINRRLARAAQHFGIPMGVGSQRVALENPEHAAIFSVKKYAPKVFLIGNLGVAQIRGKDPLGMCKRAVDMIDADALALHVNVLQEVVQVEGDRDFRGLLDQVHHIAARLGVPVIVKEVGGGIDAETALSLKAAGVAAIDCGGKGGTSWSYIEGVRAHSPVTQAVANTFRDWGIPTAIAIRALRQATPALPLIATGGVRDGLTVAKAIALGATLAGVGLPLFRAALLSDDEPFAVIETLQQGLKTAMIASGARDLASLQRRLHVSRAFSERVEQFTLATLT